ncbi:TIR domain-containing protein [Paracoccus pacificus]|uniref:TIR domain-containing protein n=1 Tax=Paracoccus pacificus TaxID=1463598 RepID=A0ABW4R7I5_9RHOB
MPDKAPRAFISYSWSSPEHEEWVLGLACDLVESGVDIVLDKWDLREGGEASAFMERMVTDTSVDKVIIVSDRAYVEKSNLRAGGAGTEAQIISSEIFAKRDEGKFVVCVRENDENGKPLVPAYYTSRIFVDFTDDSRRTERFEQLLRWLFDKPFHKKPELGTAPHYITNDQDAVRMPTGAASRRAVDALTNSKSFAKGAAQEYLEKFTAELERFRPPERLDPAGDELMNYLDDCKRSLAPTVDLA